MENPQVITYDRGVGNVSRRWGLVNSSGVSAAQAMFADARKINQGLRRDMEVSDYHLTREAAYLVFMNGDPRKPEIAAAQRYFVGV